MYLRSYLQDNKALGFISSETAHLRKSTEKNLGPILSLKVHLTADLEPAPSPQVLLVVPTTASPMSSSHKLSRNWKELVFKS